MPAIPPFMDQKLSSSSCQGPADIVVAVAIGLRHAASCCSHHNRVGFFEVEMVAHQGTPRVVAHFDAVDVIEFQSRLWQSDFVYYRSLFC